MFAWLQVLLELRVCPGAGGVPLRRDNHVRFCRSFGDYPSDSGAYLSVCRSIEDCCCCFANFGTWWCCRHGSSCLTGRH
jgi:hypothetical protein